MRNFTFYNPTKIIFGAEREADFAREVAKLGKKALVVTGGGSVKRNGIFDTIVEALKDADVAIVEESGISPNPRLNEVKDGIRIARQENVDVILAIGGGSTIDAAKLMAVGVPTDAEPWDIVLGKVKPERALPLATVLTLAATGSEMDPSSVITNLETQEKYGWGSPLVYPAVSLENPAFTTTVNAWHTAAGTADIMSHVMEQYFTLDDRAYVADSLAEGILRTAIHFGPVAIAEPDDLEARGNLMWASSLALNGLLSIGKDYPWSVHDMEHELSAKYDITHGVGLAILTPHWLNHVLNKKTAPRIARFARNVFGIQEADDVACAKAGIEALSAFFASLHIPMHLKDVDIDESRLEEMAEDLANYRHGVIDGFQPLHKEDILAIYKAAL
ncbi:MAG: iron-containing alcohol dehydrogenase [Peptoniphilaceae bacterium]|nr:iron-containing alcohol dehydrogenase [Peptoniphilaceae bacterium]MDY6085477.1 iron-containing alcohol dehydrogenase [Peptoniphilaceae bacterium]